MDFDFILRTPSSTEANSLKLQQDYNIVPQVSSQAKKNRNSFNQGMESLCNINTIAYHTHNSQQRIDNLKQHLGVISSDVGLGLVELKNFKHPVVSNKSLSKEVSIHQAYTPCVVKKKRQPSNIGENFNFSSLELSQNTFRAKSKYQMKTLL